MFAAMSYLSIRQGPVPWRGSIGLDAIEIRQLYSAPQGTGKNHLWQLCAMLLNGEEKVLLSNLPTASTARFLEHALERVLQIADQPVANSKDS